jgi:hypothetical protein
LQHSFTDATALLTQIVQRPQFNCGDAPGRQQRLLAGEGEALAGDAHAGVAEDEGLQKAARPRDEVQMAACASGRRLTSLSYDDEQKVHTVDLLLPRVVVLEVHVQEGQLELRVRCGTVPQRCTSNQLRYKPQ